MMSKKIEDYLHLYLGAKYRWKTEDDDGWRKWLVLTPYQLNGINTTGGIDIQLLLRPLSDMTDEESEQYDLFYSVNYENINQVLEYQEAERTIWLLSKHFDLFGLIEAGLAIDKTTLK